MDNYYDSEAGDWVTDQSRYEQVLAESRFAAIRDGTISDWPAARAWTLILELIATVPDDTLHYVGFGPLDDFVRRHAGEFIEQIDVELRRNARLRSAALEMYLARGELPPAIEARLSAAIVPRFWFWE